MIIRKTRLKNLFLAIVILCIATGFSPMDKNIEDSKTTKGFNTEKVRNSENQNDNTGIPYYSDNFDGDNSLASLRSRGYVIKRNGSDTIEPPPGPVIGTAASWFTGIPAPDVFNSYNGPPSGYVSSNFASTPTGGILDNWLILPPLNVASGDSICFYARGFFGIDSISVMYSVSGDTTVPHPFISSPNWVQLGRFKAVPSGQPGYWEYKAFMAPSSGATARFAIRNYIHDAGLIAPNSDWIGIDGLSIVRSPLTLNLTALIEGFYNVGLDEMVPDTATVYLSNTTSPYSIVDSSKSVLDQNGNGTFIFANAVNETPYYIIVEHRNSLETWSSSGVSFVANQTNYNFTSSSSQAFGDNMKLKATKYSIYSGDVNQDGIVDVEDMILIDNDLRVFSFGYLKTDLNGDEFIDVEDMLIVDNNAFAFVIKITP